VLLQCVVALLCCRVLLCARRKQQHIAATQISTKYEQKNVSTLRSQIYVSFEQIELPAKLLDYFFWSNKSNIIQLLHRASCTGRGYHIAKLFQPHLKVGFGISRTNADSQWNPVYNAFHRIFCCGNETIRR